MRMKKVNLILATGIAMMSFACSNDAQNLSNIKKEYEQVKAQLASNVEVVELQKNGVVPQNNNVFIANMSDKKGANIAVNFNFSNGFTTKASVNGTAAKTGADISKVDVYLVKLTSATDTDPLAPSNIIPGSPINLTKTGTNFSVLFKNVTGQPVGTNYYVALRAYDTGTNDLIKINNGGTAWTGTTATTGAGRVALSNGVNVNATTLVVSSTTALTLTANLLDSVGAQIDTAVTANAGSSVLPTLTAQ